ncbi:alpha/beta hydrolase [Massilia sp. Se16.2.3]|uniref:alpha/beta hydrolase n=1 Tax=Massilia sp. Se16.2.3 TaxID=2709303 RepID=UPI001E5EED76|nr:hypothetical protein [Massilia sp. Se16.2.3]
MKNRFPRLSALLFSLLPALAPAAPMKLADYMALQGPAPTARLPYGPAPSQYAELFVPEGAGPFPVAVLVHGGCWTERFGGITQFRNMAGALRARGIAVWNVEYRRVDEAGGGYPGMYRDMHAALTCWPPGARRASSTWSGWWRWAIRPAASWCSGSRDARRFPRQVRSIANACCRCVPWSAWEAWPTCAASAR